MIFLFQSLLLLECLLLFRRIPVWERVYCWGLIVIGILGGACATYNAMR